MEKQHGHCPTRRQRDVSQEEGARRARGAGQEGQNLIDDDKKRRSTQGGRTASESKAKICSETKYVYHLFS